MGEGRDEDGGVSNSLLKLVLLQIEKTVSSLNVVTNVLEQMRNCLGFQNDLKNNLKRRSTAEG